MTAPFFPEHILSVRATVEPGREAEFNRWYDTEHMPDAVRMFPGCTGGARYKVVLGDGSHDYMALYAFESAAKLTAALSGPEINSNSQCDSGPGTGVRRRDSWTRIEPSDSSGPWCSNS